MQRDEPGPVGCPKQHVKAGRRWRQRPVLFFQPPAGSQRRLPAPRQNGYVDWPPAARDWDFVKAVASADHSCCLPGAPKDARCTVSGGGLWRVFGCCSSPLSTFPRPSLGGLGSIFLLRLFSLIFFRWYDRCGRPCEERLRSRQDSNRFDPIATRTSLIRVHQRRYKFSTPMKSEQASTISKGVLNFGPQ